MDTHRCTFSFFELPLDGRVVLGDGGQLRDVEGGYFDSHGRIVIGGGGIIIVGGETVQCCLDGFSWLRSLALGFPERGQFAGHLEKVRKC
jgi:hypothetical protein